MYHLKIGVIILLVLLAASTAYGFDCSFKLREQDLAKLPATVTEAEIGMLGARYIKERYGLVGSEATTRRVSGISERILRAVPKRPEVIYKVEVLNTLQKGACSYPGGFIFVTKGLVNMFPVDDELAFVIAHEIAHVATGQTDRPIEQELPPRVEKRLVEMGIVGRGFAAEIAGRLCQTMEVKGEAGAVVVAAQEIRKEKELQADERGIVYASISGYNPAAVYSALDRVAMSGPGPCHPSREERKKRIDAQIEGILDRLTLFEAGVLYFVRGKYEIALDAFKTFLGAYPGPEVHHNLGMTYHRLALSNSSPSRKRETKCSLALEAKTGAENLVLRGGETESEKSLFEKRLTEAVDQYKKAIETNPNYLPAYVNLGCALIDQGKLTFAQAYLEEAIKLNPRHAAAHNNLGVALMPRGELERAGQKFNEAAKLDPKYADPYFNLGSLSEAKGEKKRAAEAWQQYLKLAGVSGGPYVELARAKLGLPEHQAARAVVGSNVEKESLPIRPGQDTRSLEKADREPVFPLDHPLSARVYHRMGITAFVLDSQVDLVLVKGGSKQKAAKGIRVGSSEKELRSAYSDPDRIEELTSGKYLMYEGAGLGFGVRDGRLTSWFAYR